MKASAEHELVERRRLLEKITGQEWQYFRRFAASKLGSTFDAEDALSDAVEAFLTSYPVDRDLEGVSGWMVQAIKFICLRGFEKQAVRGKVNCNLDDIIESLVVTDASMSVEGTVALRVAFRGLRPGHRKAIALNLAGYSHAESAGILGLSCRGSKLRLAKARQEMKASLNA